MTYEVERDFERLRNEWALKANVQKWQIDAQRQMDNNANPYNEPYFNKRPIRTETQIIADLSYQFADDLLCRQYGRLYRDWLDANFRQDQWKTGHRKVV